MSIDNYSQELRNYISSKTKFIDDNSFHPKEQLEENTIIIEEYIEREMYYPEIKCLFFYLTYLIKDELFRNTIISNINKKFTEKNIKAREMPDIHYLIVYKISEEDFLNQNINKIKQYFEDYLKRMKEAEEHEKLKKKLEEEAKLKEMKEKQKRERFILPKIKTCEIVEVSENSATIIVPLYDENEIIKKNKYSITNCIEKYSKTVLEYVVYFYNKEKNIYEKQIFKKTKENIIEKNKYKIKVTNLKEDEIYLFLLGIKFAENYSNPTSNKFYFITSPKLKYGRIFIYGDYIYKNNFVDIDEREESIKLPKNIKSYKECLEDEKTLFPLLYGDIIKDIDVSEKRTCCINCNGIVIEAGEVISVQPGDYFEGCFPEDKEIKADDTNLEITYENVCPYQIVFNVPKINIKKISVGERHCLALSSMGECYSWGLNDFGQLGLGKDKNDIIGNPTKIKFDIFDLDGHKYITDQKPIFYEIATGSYSSFALGIFNNRQILYYWGKGAGILNDNSSQIIQSSYPVPINGIDNIKKIYARYNSIGIFCKEKNKNINILYIHGTQKFGIDAGIGIYDKPKPIIVNFFKDKNISVLNVNFSNNCMSVIGKNKEEKNEVYLRGEILYRLFGFKEYKNKFMKLDKNWAENVVAISPQEKVILFLLNNGVVKKLGTRGKNLYEKDIKIEGYDEVLKDLNIEDIDKIKFQSFLDENFVILYQKKEKEN